MAVLPSCPRRAVLPKMTTAQIPIPTTTTLAALTMKREQVEPLLLPAAMRTRPY